MLCTEAPALYRSAGTNCPRQVSFSRLLEEEVRLPRPRGLALSSHGLRDGRARAPPLHRFGAASLLSPAVPSHSSLLRPCQWIKHFLTFFSGPPHSHLRRKVLPSCGPILQISKERPRESKRVFRSERTLVKALLYPFASCVTLGKSSSSVKHGNNSPRLIGLEELILPQC